MKSIKKFYDVHGVEVPPEKAVRCVELLLDARGKVVKTIVYKPK